MAALWQSIVDFLTTLAAFVANLFAGTFQLLQIIPQGLSYMMTSISYLPPALTVIATALVTISVTYLIIGR